jgi:hypothetical protein
MVFAAFIIANGISFRILSQGTDSAGFLELIKMPFPNLSLENSTLASHGLGLMSTFGYSADEICRFVTNYEPKTVSHWPYHPYLISILLGGLSNTPGVNPLFISSFSIAVSYLLGLYIIYLFMRRRNIHRKVIIFWILLVLISPPVFESLRGQIYFDRIFMGPGIGLVIGTLILHENFKDKLGKRLLYFSIPASLLISDRTTFSAALILIILPLSLTISKRHIFNSFPFLLRTIPFGLLALVWYLIWGKFIKDSFYSSQGNVVELLSVENIQNSFYRLSGYQFPYFLTFLGTILLFVFLSTLNVRSIPLLILVLLPNILVDVGGAQLNGYLTHYHQLYIPVLLSLATIGLTNTQKIVSSKFSLGIVFRKTTFLLTTVATIIFWISNSTYSGSVNTFVGKIGQAYGLFPADRAGMLYLENQLSPLATEFAEHEIRSISTLESLMPFVVQKTSYVVSYFPAGVGMSDAVLVNYDNGQSLPVVYPYGEPSSGVTIRVSECVQAVLDQNYRRVIEIERGSYRTLLYLKNGIK